MKNKKPFLLVKYIFYVFSLDNKKLFWKIILKHDFKVYLATDFHKQLSIFQKKNKK